MQVGTTRLTILLAGVLAFSCGEDAPNGTGDGTGNGAGAGNGSSNGQNDPDWSYQVTSNNSGRDFPEGEGGSISVTPSGSPDAPAQLTLSSAVPLYVINFFVETPDGSLAPGSYSIANFLWQTPDLICGDAGAQAPPQMTLVVESVDPPRGSFVGAVTCGNPDDSFTVTVEGNFDDA